MGEFQSLLINPPLVVALVACGLAQLSKLIVELVQHRRFNPKVLVETGGMPSSHSAFVAALAAAVGESIGWSSVEFAIATVFAIVVMYDAAGVRWAAGRQAAALNQLIERLEPEQAEEFSALKEALGHTKPEVFIGSVIGVAVAMLAYELLPLA